MLLNEKPKEHSVSDEAMRTMFAARKAVFVDLLKWDVPVLAGQYEVDQFDDPHANYIILAEPDGNHLGSARLAADDTPAYPRQFLYRSVRRGPAPRARHRRDHPLLPRSPPARRRAATGARRTGDRAGHLCAANGITAYTAIASVPWFSQIMTFGWDCRPLGMPRDVDGKPTVALRIEITLETPSCSRMPGSSRCPCPTMASSWPEGARSMDTINIPYAIIAGHIEDLRRNGYCVIKDALPSSLIAALEDDLEPTFAVTPFGTAAFMAKRPNASVDC
jgi:acyl-homoserine lactone synthase